MTVYDDAMHTAPDGIGRSQDPQVLCQLALRALDEMYSDAVQQSQTLQAMTEEHFIVALARQLRRQGLYVSTHEPHRQVTSPSMRRGRKKDIDLLARTCIDPSSGDVRSIWIECKYSRSQGRYGLSLFGLDFLRLQLLEDPKNYLRWVWVKLFPSENLLNDLGRWPNDELRHRPVDASQDFFLKITQSGGDLHRPNRRHLAWQLRKLERFSSAGSMHVGVWTSGPTTDKRVVALVVVTQPCPRPIRQTHTRVRPLGTLG